MNEDHEKTAIRTRRMPFRPAPDSDADQSANVLPIGTHLGEFEILDLIGEGGFGIVYLAYDHSLERHVALKEYMPSGLATRTTQMAVTVRSQRNADTFTAGLKSFINEARILAQFDSPSLVKVHRFWEGNGTAYMVMPFYEGITLKQALKERRIVPSEQWIRLLLADLFDAIDTIHRAHCLHRDIAPDNILLLKDGRPLLLDFGAARRVITDLTQRLTVILKPGFAPIEQYANSAGLRQGAWTDIYALAAVVYYLITGKAPPPAVARMVHDEMVPAREAGKGRYGPAFLAAIDKALAVRPEQRFRSIEEMRGALGIMEAVPRTMPQSAADWSTTVARTAPMAEPPHVVPEARPAEEDITRFDPYWNTHVAAGAGMAERPHRKRTWTVLGVMLSAGIAAGVIWEVQNRRDAPPEPPAVASNGSALQSSGSSGTAEQEADEPPVALAPRTPTPAPPAPAAPAPSAAPPAALPKTPSTPPVAPPPRASAADDSTAAVTDTPAAPPQRSEEIPVAPRTPTEIELWRMASASDKAADYAAYLKQFPEGRYAALARLRYERKQGQLAAVPSTSKPAPPKPQLRPEREPKAAPAAPPAIARGDDDEGRLWTATTALNQAPAYETYLNLYPKGRYAALAKDRLASLQPARPAEPPAPPADLPQPPRTTEAAPEAQRGTEQHASIKPSDAEPPPLPKPATEAMPKPAPAPAAPPVAADRKSLKLDDQTMIGDFSVDPKTGIVSGSGKIVWSNGNQFEGTLVRGKKEGKGKFAWHNGQRYNGDWARDMPNGKGTITFANGNRYEGDVKDGLPHGQGTNRFSDGDVYSGAWVNGKSHGRGRYTWTNGSYWEGEFRNDQRTENGTMVFSEAALRAAREQAATRSSGGASASGRTAAGSGPVEK